MRASLFAFPSGPPAPAGPDRAGVAARPAPATPTPRTLAPAALPAPALAPATGLPTPWLDLDLGIVRDRYAELAAALPGTAIHYAVKANPHPAVLAALHAAGSRFDVASPAELQAARTAGARPADLVYSNPIKRRDDIASAYAAGVRLFVVDSAEETHKVAQAAPGSSVLARLVTSGHGSDWPLSRKFGASTQECVGLLGLAAALGLDPAGVAFHVGSQQHDPGAWRRPIRAAARVFQALRAAGHAPWLLDLGGGFPADHEGELPHLADFGRAIEGSLHEAFGPGRPHTIVEPGRGLVGDAGTLVASVVTVLRRGETRWVYLDVGVFTGLVETLEEAIRYRLSTSVDGGPVSPAVLAGPTCDSADVLYERIPVLLPDALTEGDLVYLHSAGAYTTCYSTVGFNGFAPLECRLVARAEGSGR